METHKRIRPKLRLNNTIIISPSKTYTQQEMISLFNKFTNQYPANISIMYLQDEFPKWIEENL